MVSACGDLTNNRIVETPDKNADEEDGKGSPGDGEIAMCPLPKPVPNCVAPDAMTLARNAIFKETSTDRYPVSLDEYHRIFHLPTRTYNVLGCTAVSGVIRSDLSRLYIK